jgi:hypothetical protein
VIWTISYHDNLPTAAQEKMCAPSNSFSSERLRLPTRYWERASTKGLMVIVIIKLNYSAGSWLGAPTCSARVRFLVASLKELQSNVGSFAKDLYGSRVG